MDLEAMIKEVDRELAVRAHVYPNQVAAGRMREIAAHNQIERMKQVRILLDWMRDNGDTIKQRLSY